MSSIDELDHVLLAAVDLTEAARELERRHGLLAVEGGRHPGWGTENRIVPLGDAYLELIAISDEAEAACTVFGRWLADRRSEPYAPLGWAVRTSSIDDRAGALGLAVELGSRARPDGSVSSWRLAGVAEAAAAPFLPFFIEWAAGTVLPGRAPVQHPAGEVGVERLVLHGDDGRLTDWLGGLSLPIVLRAGAPALAAIVLRGDSGEIVLSAER